jgi:hypothetical protein
MMKKDESSLFMKKDNTEKYKSIYGLLPDDIKQLLSLDTEIDESFNNQMKKRNKNDEMVRNKIEKLNEKPILRAYVF